MTKTEILTALQAAAEVPEVQPFGQLAAGMVMNGWRLPPQDMWEDIANKLKQDDAWCGDGIFEAYENHARNKSHEEWQNAIDAIGDGDRWFIPVEEFICLAYEDEYACDFVTLTRLVFVGTEEEFRAVVKTVEPE